jgi:hypothetical protein
MSPETKTLYVMPVREIVAILSSSADAGAPAARLRAVGWDDRASRAAERPRRRLLPDEISARPGTDRPVPSLS